MHSHLLSQGKGNWAPQLHSLRGFVCPGLCCSALSLFSWVEWTFISPVYHASSCLRTLREFFLVPHATLSLFSPHLDDFQLASNLLKADLSSLPFPDVFYSSNPLPVLVGFPNSDFFKELSPFSTLYLLLWHWFFAYSKPCFPNSMLQFNWYRISVKIITSH